MRKKKQEREKANRGQEKPESRERKRKVTHTGSKNTENRRDKKSPKMGRNIMRKRMLKN